jgi:hypothetical protein
VASFLLQFGALDGTVPRSPGVVVDNTDAVYQFDSDPALSPAEAALNAAVLRVAQTPAGRVEHGVANVPVVNGTPPASVLTLHDLGDLFVAFSMEQVYAGLVAPRVSRTSSCSARSAVWGTATSRRRSS